MCPQNKLGITVTMVPRTLSQSVRKLKGISKLGCVQLMQTLLLDSYREGG